MSKLLRAVREWGVGGTLQKAMRTKHLKFGELKGVDKWGNKYYENLTDYPLGECAVYRAISQAVTADRRSAPLG